MCDNVNHLLTFSVYLCNDCTLQQFFSCELQLYTIPYVRKSVLALNSPADDLVKEEEELRKKATVARNPVHNVSTFLCYVLSYAMHLHVYLL